MTAESALGLKDFVEQAWNRPLGLAARKCDQTPLLHDLDHCFLYIDAQVDNAQLRCQVRAA